MLQIDRVASVFVVQPLLTAGLVRSKPGIPILMYHSVSDDRESGLASYYRLVTTPARFREQMRWLGERGYAVIDLAEALRCLAAGNATSQRAVVLTFDDGFRDFATHAWPVLEELGFAATVFLPTGFIGRTRQSFKGRECLTWAEVRQLHRRRVRFGGHTVTHRLLYGLPWADIRRELRESRLRIEDELDSRVDTFAYPLAFPQQDHAFVRRFRAELLEQGYAGSVTTIIGRAASGDDALCLKRLPVNQADDHLLFESKLLGAYDWLGRVQSIVRCAKGRLKPPASR